MGKILVKTIEQNINFLNSGDVKSGYKMYPVRYSTMSADDIVESCTKNSYVPKAFIQASLVAITEAIENYLLNGHSIVLPDFGIFSISCESNVSPTANTAGIEQFKGLNINFRPSTTLKEKLKNVDIELDGIYRCLDLSVSNKVYEKVTQAADSTTNTPDNNEEPNQGTGGNTPGGTGGDLEG